MADLIILTEEAKKVAMCEKNRPRSPRSHQRIFLPEMRPKAGNDRKPPGATITFLIFQAVHPAIPRAEAAGLQLRQSFVNSCGEVALSGSFDINGLRNFSPLPILQEISFFCTDGEPISLLFWRASVVSLPLRVRRIWVGVNPYSIKPIFSRPFRHFPKFVRAF